APTPTPTVPPLAQRFNAQPDDIVNEVRPGVFHIRRVTDEPMRINLLLFDLTAPELTMRVGLNEGWLSGRQRTSNLAAQQGAIAAVNGDLFAENGIPQGLTLIDGKVATAPKHRATFAWSRARGPSSVCSPTSGRGKPTSVLLTASAVRGLCGIRLVLPNRSASSMNLWVAWRRAPAM
ncbi:hypothetical protein HC891_26065, partial [Candidatus Gracilibacteria bacterium]|nr:hypothetical protein [Candidatus Gracilibacteria bacterium]